MYKKIPTVVCTPMITETILITDLSVWQKSTLFTLEQSKYHNVSSAKLKTEATTAAS
jgi:hypothetical protein